ncbi:TrkH family potassium uptake protein [Spectribacter hydrogenoxidans]|uniref:TrkH family potassium uptake protein n=1 Tax=Spectribacter hydrogenoxidans TaxID=3075608 RepID=A0ABU3BY67_9GAMM|nr:TrkH family potassium uptake protein [Salinisphaera sp. W335]MDT0634260.1 TrkH family potassium uptake protein [Salinisphaera sp. W335]
MIRTATGGPHGPVLRGIGILLHVPAAMAVLSIPVALLFGETAGVGALAITFICALALGQLLFWSCHDAAETRRRHAFLIAALSWLAVSTLGALPFYLSGHAAYAQPLDALFESLSGFTTTGISLVADPATLPAHLQWWRSFSEWVGAVGVIVVMLSVLPTHQSALALYRSEARRQKILPSVRTTVQAIWSIYLIYTGLAISLLWLLGEPLWQAVNHGMTAIATGGFTVVADPITDAGPARQLAYGLITIMGAIGFALHYRFIRSGRGLFSGLEARSFWWILLGGALLITLENALAAPDVAWSESLFVWVMAVTTAGFAHGDVSAWPPLTLMLLTLAVTLGAMAGSTSGGLKLARLVTLFKAIGWSLTAAARSPHQVMRYMMDGEALTRAEAGERVRAATTLTIGWLLLALAGLFAMLHFVPADTPLGSTLFEVFAIQSNTGMSADAIDYDTLPAGGKLVAMLLMWTGRLEIVPVMVMIALIIERRR